jgi:hypothetical protein
MTFDPYEPATPDTNGEPPPEPMPGEPDIPNDHGGWR